MRGRIARLLCLAVVCLALAGCALPTAPEGNAESLVGTAKDNASAATCRTNRAQIAQAYSMALIGGSDSPTDFNLFVADLGVKCPSGGAYSWVAASEEVKCSVHGE